MCRRGVLCCTRPSTVCARKELCRMPVFPLRRIARSPIGTPCRSAMEEIGLPAVLKTCSGGYDGKGQRVIRDRDEAIQAYEQLAGSGQNWCWNNSFRLTKNYRSLRPERRPARFAHFRPLKMYMSIIFCICRSFRRVFPGNCRKSGGARCAHRPIAQCGRIDRGGNVSDSRRTVICQ